MHYYARYPGHYLVKTMHLTMEQDGAYGRLLDWCYINEKPIPDRARFAIARAQKPSEKKAVDFVLSEFFFRTENGWENVRVNDEIRKAAPRIHSAKANGIKGGRPKKRKPSQNPVGFQNVTDARTETEPIAEPAGFVRARVPQSPIPKKAKDSLASLEDLDDARPEVRACVLVRRRGCAIANPAHPELLAAIAEGVTPEALDATYAEGVAGGKAKPWPWAIATARSRRAQGAAPAAGTGPPRRMRVELPSETAYAGTCTDDLPESVR